jgi:cyanophycinase-like exopeptidase
MTTAAVHTTGFFEAPKLRLLPKGGSVAVRRSRKRRSALRLLGAPSASVASASQAQPILLAGGDQSARTSVLRDLARSMPPSTSFEQASAIWEVLARAPQSKLVILSGALEGIPAQALMQMLGHRHPEVPVVCIDDTSSVAA